MVRLHVPQRRRERGAVLIIALIVIVLISLTVVSAYNLSTSDLKSVGNVQYRNEAVTAANAAIETVVSGSFLGALNTSGDRNIDLDKDGTTDYKAKVYIPQCPLRVRMVSQDLPSGYEFGDGTSTVAGTYIADYELKAVVEDSATGARTTIRQGVRIPLTETEYQTYVNTSTCGLTLITT